MRPIAGDVTLAASVPDRFLPLSRPYVARHGAPLIARVDPQLFERRYFARCMGCGFCGDACCDHGVDADAPVVALVLARAAEIEPHVGVPRDQWFEAETEHDADAPGGWFRRTRVRDGRCVFRHRTGRGCVLHGFALGAGIDYHDVKPMVSTLFPVTFAEGTLFVSDELDDGTLVCAGDGPTAYEAARPELAYYFGEEFVAELDGLAAETSETTQRG